MKILSYKFTATWCAGKNHQSADSLSRYPVNDLIPADELADGEIDFYLNAVLEVVKHEAEEDLQLEGIREAASKDNEYQELLHVIKNSFPLHKSDLPYSIRHYWPIRDRLKIDDGYILSGCRLLIPNELRHKKNYMPVTKA